NEHENQRIINERLEATNSRTSNRLQTASKALEETQKVKADVESTLQAKEQEMAEKQREIENLKSQVQARVTAKATLAKATVQPVVTSPQSNPSIWDKLAQCEATGNWA